MKNLLVKLAAVLFTLAAFATPSLAAVKFGC